ncbi:MAG TPA: NADPH-dependent FMN reductase [Gemmatimonadales bacterium]|nr:NADPH-dependent FMN reductase [Gemmatimonadales bacterium]
MIRILAISGSLRAGSSNTEVLRALAALAPAGVQFDLYDGLAGLPHFSPDLEQPELPPPVSALRRRVADADVLLISSPEYAHGVPGSLKNALDWLVSGFEFVALPVALVNPSPHSLYAQAALLETIRTMSAELVTPEAVTIPLTGRRLSSDAILAEPALAAPLGALMQTLVAAAQASRAGGRRLRGPLG